MKVKQVELEKIKSPSDPVRESLGDMTQLTQSVAKYGVLQPVKLLATKKRGRAVLEYEVIFGNRRVEAARRAGWASVPAIVVLIGELDQATETLKQALTENLQRADMSPLEKAHSLKRLLDFNPGWTITTIAQEGIMPRKTASGYLALLKLPEDVQSMITKDVGGRGRDRRTKPLTVEHVSKAAPAGKHKDQVLRKAARENLTSRQVHKVAKTVQVALSHGDSARAKSLIETYEYSDRLFDPEREAKRYEPDLPEPKIDLSSDIDDQARKSDPSGEHSDYYRILMLVCRLGSSVDIIKTAIENSDMIDEEKDDISHKLINHSAAVRLLADHFKGG